MSDNTGTQALWPQMISALAAIDRELGLPDDGCNSLAQTLSAIRALKAKAELSQALARTVMADQTSHDRLHELEEVVGQILDDGHMNTENLARLRAAYGE